ncbi:helix-turn-helix domain-containing protein [Jiangella ureilytica]|uniref:Helix-turn-helix domain-containing protein n=1 Tax=Jiangella ureilytica TaxID=2530374 RepID=A0A4R4RQ07_9ACTN|nr:helix-turn-helix domain-containing protein [Jiangella ureilytica]TDC51596.1 helix-turn-helix domain-containing protein [Jiangella ureilytica]
MYRERPSRIPHAVLWSSTVQVAETHRVLPDGCLDLLWTGGRLTVAGPDTVAHIALWQPGTPFVGLRFGSGVGPRVLGLPAHELRDQRVPLDQLWPAAQVRRLTERLAEAPGPGGLIEAFAHDRLGAAPQADPVVERVAERLGQGAAVGEVAREVGLSARQLHRRSLDAFGYGPKTLARILRLHRALELGRSGTAAAEAAYAAGYADQAHLSREVRSLTGVTLTSLVA